MQDSEENISVMTQPIWRAAKSGAYFGFAIGLLVLIYGYLEPRMHSPAINDWLVFAACPPSIALMAADNAKWYVLIFADLLVLAANAVWYGFLFGVVGLLFRSTMSRT